LCIAGRERLSAFLLAGLRVWRNKIHEGAAIASVMHGGCGLIDPERKTLQAFDNPFGPRLSPMS